MTCKTAGLGIALVTASLSGITASAQAADWYGNWGYRVKISFSNVVGTVTNFPVLITHDNVKTELFAHAQTNGYDILFTDADGTTKLAHELERFHPASSQLWAWVKVPLLSIAAPTNIYLYYGKPGTADQQDASNVWDSDFIGVWHLSEASGAAQDSSTKNCDLTPHNGVVQNAAGKIGGASQFDTNDDYYAATTAAGVVSNITAAMWINIPDPTNAPTYKTIVYESCQFCMSTVKTSGGALNCKYRNDAIAWQDLTKTAFYGTSEAGKWYYLTITRSFAGTSGDVRFYRNGIDAWGANPVSGMPGGSFDALTVGGLATPGSALSGSMDELQLSRTARPSSWIKTCYNNQSSPSTFAFASDEETYIPKSRGTLFKIL